MDDYELFRRRDVYRLGSSGFVIILPPLVDPNDLEMFADNLDSFMFQEMSLGDYIFDVYTYSSFMTKFREKLDNIISKSITNSNNSDCCKCTHDAKRN